MKILQIDKKREIFSFFNAFIKILKVGLNFPIYWSNVVLN